MHTSGIFKLSLWVLLSIAFPALSFPPIALDEQTRNALSQKSPLKSRSELFIEDSDHQGAHLLDIALHKRLGYPTGNGLTLYALRVAIYIGAHTVLENLYLRMIAEAANQPPGLVMFSFTARYGDVLLSFNSEDIITWDMVQNFADMMLNRVRNGEQALYVGDIVADLPDELGRSVVHLMMGTPETG
ncbi:hypothetical protein G7Y79_00029g063560 [Physcia stellaris]|nr:hypothetical protein G7Y79_00029g063560 [Physcia stellaris]